MENSKDEKTTAESPQKNTKEEGVAAPLKKQFTTEEGQEIVSRLTEQGATNPCARCGGKKFQILNGYFSNAQQVDLKKTILGGPSIPCAVIICSNCGAISQHALGVIGLLDKGGGKDG